MFLSTETSIPGSHQFVGIVHATGCKGGQFETENSIVKYMEEATNRALSELAARAAAMGATGVIGVQIAVSRGVIVSVTVLGTAIRI